MSIVVDLEEKFYEKNSTIVAISELTGNARKGIWKKGIFK